MSVKLPLTDELAGVLFTVACNDMSERATLAKAMGRSVRADVSQLQALGLVRSMKSTRIDGTRTWMWSITPKGSEVLDARRGNVPSTAIATNRLPFSDELYVGTELHAYTGRPGAMDAYALPSRVGTRLHFPDGRVAPVTPSNRPTAAA